MHTSRKEQRYQLLPSKKVRELIGVSSMTLYRLYTYSDLPTPIKINNRNFWRLSDVQDWIDQRSAA
jgi:predicted DNA-binding transcriptional regulator AlpA